MIETITPVSPAAQSREELEAEVAALRAQQSAAENVAPELSTRERSPIKPQDYQPAATDIVNVEFGGVEFKVKKGAFDSLRTLDMLERGLINTALRSLVGDAGYSEFLEKNPDADSETAGKLLEQIAEKAGAKN